MATTAERRVSWPHPSFWAAARAAINGYARILSTWQERPRQRRQVLRLSDHELRDIGICRADAVGNPAYWLSRVDRPTGF